MMLYAFSVLNIRTTMFARSVIFPSLNESTFSYSTEMYF